MKTDERRTVIGGNWKLNGMPGDCRRFAAGLADALDTARLPEIILAVPYVLIPEALEAFAGTPVRVAAQNVSAHGAGAFTGEVSADQLAAFGVTCTLVGHSERRQLFGETDADVTARLQAGLDAGLNVMLCVGEGESVRVAEQQESWVDRQMTAALSGLSLEDLPRLMIAYEPIWAIGTGRSATPADADAMGAFIRRWLTERFGSDGAGIPVLYGGSVNPGNAGELLAAPFVDGALVGGASLKADSFSAIIRASSRLPGD